MPMRCQLHCHVSLRTVRSWSPSSTLQCWVTPYLFQQQPDGERACADLRPWPVPETESAWRTHSLVSAPACGCAVLAAGLPSHPREAATFWQQHGEQFVEHYPGTAAGLLFHVMATQGSAITASLSQPYPSDIDAAPVRSATTCCNITQLLYIAISSMLISH